MTGWYDLALELRWSILDYMDDLLVHLPAEQAVSTAPALVCREWAYRFQHYYFHTLVLDQHRLSDFDKIVSDNPRLRDHVRMIRLHVKLAEYKCDDCDVPESAKESGVNSRTFALALQKLMNIVSKWPQPTSKQGHGLALDLGAYSPSDSKHSLMDYRLSEGFPAKYGASADMYGRHRKEALDKRRNEGLAERCPGWARVCEGRQGLLRGQRQRILSRLTTSNMRPTPFVVAKDDEEHWPIRFASAPRFDELWISRRCYRRISTDILHRLIRQSLPGLRHFRHEGWVYPEMASLSQFQHDYCKVVRALPQGLDTFSFFHENSVAMRRTRGDVELPVPSDLDLGLALARLAMRLSVFNAAGLVDAGDFLQPSSSSWETGDYPRLERLTLTTRKLDYRNPSCWPWNLGELLLKAAKMAFWKMPALKSLEIWSGRDGDYPNDSFLISFSVDNGVPHVTWSSTTGSVWYDTGLNQALRLMAASWNHLEPQRPLHIFQAYGLEPRRQGHNIIGKHPVLCDVLHPESREQMWLEDHQPQVAEKRGPSAVTTGN